MQVEIKGDRVKVYHPKYLNFDPPLLKLKSNTFDNVSYTLD